MARKKPTAADQLSPRARRYWAPFVRTLPPRVQPAFWRDIVAFERRLERAHRAWARTLAQEFAPAAGMDPKQVERDALARDRARQSARRRRPRPGGRKRSDV
jgi:hypothetical protein